MDNKQRLIQKIKQSTLSNVTKSRAIEKIKTIPELIELWVEDSFSIRDIDESINPPTPSGKSTLKVVYLLPSPSFYRDISF